MWKVLQIFISDISMLVGQSCQTLCNPLDCSQPGSSVHGIFQARIVEWVAISFSMVIFLTQELNPVLPHCRQILYYLSHQGSSLLNWKFLVFYSPQNFWLFTVSVTEINHCGSVRFCLWCCQLFYFIYFMFFLGAHIFKVDLHVACLLLYGDCILNFVFLLNMFLGKINIWYCHSLNNLSLVFSCYIFYIFF